MSSRPSQDITANWTTLEASLSAAITERRRKKPVVREEGTVISKLALIYNDNFEAI
jgi:hypothetical protein